MKGHVFVSLIEQINQIESNRIESTQPNEHHGKPSTDYNTMIKQNTKMTETGYIPLSTNNVNTHTYFFDDDVILGC